MITLIRISKKFGFTKAATLASSFFDRIAKSQLIVAIAATLLTAETYLLSQLTIDTSVLVIVFFATWLSYNFSRLTVNVRTPTPKNRCSLSLSGPCLNFILASLSLIGLFIASVNCERAQFFYLGWISILTLAYMLPVSVNGRRMSGVRNVCIGKNILLSLIWALATVTLPLSDSADLLPSSVLPYLFVRRFLFVYSLAIAFDIRDIVYDQNHGLATVPTQYGLTATRCIALCALVAFSLLTILDPLSQEVSRLPFSLALTFSALLAGVIVFLTDATRREQYYCFAIDGVMIVQFLLCAVIRH